MTKYNITTVGGEILNLDGPLERDEANRLAAEIEAENNIDIVVKENLDGH